MLTLLGFGSSARRGATGWTDATKIRRVVDACQPDRCVHGASAAGGADAVFAEQAREHFFARGSDTAPVMREPVDTSVDGPWPAAGHRRNARMYRTWMPNLAAGFISGKVGSPLSSGSAGMLRICQQGLFARQDRRVMLAPPCAVVVYRDDGVEPDPDPLATMRRLYAVTRDERLIQPGKALAMGAPRDETLAALAFAAEGSRWAPWIEAVEAAVRGRA